MIFWYLTSGRLIWGPLRIPTAFTEGMAWATTGGGQTPVTIVR